MKYLILSIPLFLSGCRADLPGDPLPNPVRVKVDQQASQYVYDPTTEGQPGAEMSTEEDADRAMRAADDFIRSRGAFVIRGN